MQTSKMNSSLPPKPANAIKPLEGILVLDFSQFLSGPSAALRLADLGARVIKIERPETGDICRTLYISNLDIDGDSSLFHAINRNKESFAADLKKAEDMQLVRALIGKADVLIQNFRPGVMRRLGLDYEAVKRINPDIIYGEATGYGNDGPWRNAPGQDLLVQSRSGLAWLNGDAAQPPMPFGLSIVDMITGAHLAQGILAGLVRRSISGGGMHIGVNLMESILDFQFEVLTTYLNDGGRPPQRSSVGNANAYLGAPYGIYATSDGYLALAMGSVTQLGELLECPALLAYENIVAWSSERDAIKKILAEHLVTKPTADWLAALEPADYWCAEVLDWERLIDHEGFKVLDMVQEVSRQNGAIMRTTRCPIRIDGQLYKSAKGSPRLGEDTQCIKQELHRLLKKGGL